MMDFIADMSSRLQTLHGSLALVAFTNVGVRSGAVDPDDDEQGYRVLRFTTSEYESIRHLVAVEKASFYIVGVSEGTLGESWDMVHHYQMEVCGAW